MSAVGGGEKKAVGLDYSREVISELSAIFGWGFGRIVKNLCKCLKVEVLKLGVSGCEERLGAVSRVAIRLGPSDPRGGADGLMECPIYLIWLVGTDGHEMFGERFRLRVGGIVDS